MLKEIFKHLMTGADNKTWHMGKFSWAGSTFTICAVIVYRAVYGLDVDLLAAAGALVAVATGHSAAIYGMKTTEPDTKAKPLGFPSLHPETRNRRKS